MSRTPSVVARRPASAIRRTFTSSGNGDAVRSTRSSTAVATLLTFCPPGPEPRTNRSSMTSPSSNECREFMLSCVYHGLITDGYVTPHAVAGRHRSLHADAGHDHREHRIAVDGGEPWRIAAAHAGRRRVVCAGRRDAHPGVRLAR